METKYIVDICAGFIPIAVGYIWYHPKLLGRVLKASGDVNNEKLQAGHAWWVYPLAWVCGYYIASAMHGVVIHQYGLEGMLANQPDLWVAGTPLNTTAQGLLDKYADNFRTFKHGAYHGYHLGLYLVLPIFAILTLFEKKRWTYLAIHASYWIICITLIGGVVCAYIPHQIILAK